MTKVELVSYLADLLTIDAYLDDLGIAHPWLNREEEETLKLIEGNIRDEQEVKDEARKK